MAYYGRNRMTRIVLEKIENDEKPIDKVNKKTEEQSEPKEDLIDTNGLTKMEYFDDYCHLNYKKVKPLIENKFKNVII